MKKALGFATALVALYATPAFAQAGDGQLSQTQSSASFNVTTNIPQMVRISGLEDLTLNVTAASVASGTGAQNVSQRFCVYSNSTLQGLYKLTADGQSGDELNSGEAKFSLNGPEGTRLSFALWTSDRASDVYYKGTATPGVAKSMQTAHNGQARATTLNCNGTDNASMNVRFTNARLLAALAGSYTGTLTFTVAPL
ncbi:hypothetical protein ACX0GZ_05890 [Sphingomonas aestuarii]